MQNYLPGRRLIMDAGDRVRVVSWLTLNVEDAVAEFGSWNDVCSIPSCIRGPHPSFVTRASPQLPRETHVRMRFLA